MHIFGIRYRAQRSLLMLDAKSRANQEIADDILAKAAEVIKCLGHPLRLRLVEALEQGEKTVTELQEHSGASQAAVSQQLATMRARGMVDNRREGARVFYRITEPKVVAILACIRSCDLPRSARQTTTAERDGGETG